MTPRFATSCIAAILAVSFGAAATAGPRETRDDFLRMIDRPRVPLRPEVSEMPGAGLFQIHFSIATEAGERVPGILIRQTSAGRKPAVLVLHGTGGKKEAEIPLLKELAGKGFTAIAIDGRHHGERTRSGSGSAEYSAAILRTYRTQKGHPFLYDTVWDVLRLLDYLETRDDVDARRIGVIGFSKGGMETYLAAAVDSRIAVAVPCVGVQSFRWALDNNSWQSRVGTFQAAIDGASKDEGISKVDAAFVRKFYDRVVPGIYSQFDGPAMVPLVAPRPLLMINGDSDPRTPRPGLMECAAAAEKAYAAASAQDKLVLHLQENTGHQVRPASLELAVAWFVKWLKP